MRQRMLLRRRYRRSSPPRPGTILMMTFIAFTIATFGSIVFIGEGITPALMEAARTKTNEFATRGINQAVKFAEEYSIEDIAITERTESGYISIVDWDSSVVNKINRAATDRVEEFFHSMNRGETPKYEDPLGEPVPYGDTVDELVDRDPTVIEIPIGQATGNTILANLGPRIPVNLELVGAVRTELVEEIQTHGINNVFVSLFVEVEADVQIIVPFVTEPTTVKTNILVDKSLVMGQVPDFYGGSNNPSIAIPKDDLDDD